MVACAPSYATELAGTTWSIGSVDNRPLAAPVPTITFDDGDTPGRLNLSCGELQVDVFRDTDGDGMHVYLPNEPNACTGKATQQDVEAMEALATVDHWSREGDGQITLQGGSTDLGLERVP